MAKPSRLADYEDLRALPEHMVGELIDGELFASPRPAPAHARTAIGLSADLFNHFDRPPGAPPASAGWWFLVEPELHLHGAVLVPDIAGWRRSNLPMLPTTGVISVTPDFVCEVLSPSTGRLDRTRKMAVYAREGVAHLWLVDPMLRTIEVYRLDAASRWIVVCTYDGDQPVRAEPFEAVALDPSRWWLDP